MQHIDEFLTLSPASASECNLGFSFSPVSGGSSLFSKASPNTMFTNNNMNIGGGTSGGGNITSEINSSCTTIGGNLLLSSPVSSSERFLCDLEGVPIDLDQAFAQLVSDVGASNVAAQAAAVPFSLHHPHHAPFSPSTFDLQQLLATSLPAPTLSSFDNTSFGRTNNGNKTKPPPLKLPPQPAKSNLAKQLTTTTTVATPAASLNSTKASLPSVASSESLADFEDDSKDIPAAPGTRVWQTIFADPAFADKLSVKVTSKTRCEEPSEEVPSKLYSSLKYEIRQTATGQTCNELPFLLARCTVVDSVEFNEVLKDKKSVLKGVVEGSIVKPTTKIEGASKNEPLLYGTLKVQFTDVSYHHKKRDFCFQISYFTPSDLDRPILIKRSAPFKVLARRPNQGKKRRHCDMVAASSSSSDPLDQFSKQLDELVQASKRMKTEDRRNALTLVTSKLMQLDPALWQEQVTLAVSQQANN